MLFSVGAAVSDEINCFPVGIAPVNHGIDLVHAFVDQGPGGAPAAAVVCAEKRCVLFLGPAVRDSTLAMRARLMVVETTISR